MSSTPKTTPRPTPFVCASRRARQKTQRSVIASKQDAFAAACTVEPHRDDVAAYFNYKPWIDRVITAMLMIVALPVMVAVGLAILVRDGRPILYCQTRVGKTGRLFRIWKFRTMQRDAEGQTGAVWSCVSDPRVTRLGWWLRSSHLDELPQLFNVLAGDMNLIGPRPERPEFVSELAREVPFYLERVKVAPGLTGPAQIRTGYDHSLADVRSKVLIDIEYLKSTSFLNDMKLLAQTCTYIVGHLREIRSGKKPAPQMANQRNANVTFVGPQACAGTPKRRLVIPPLWSVERLAPFTDFIDNPTGVLATQNLLANDMEECA
ncbi:MAG: sugar transferase [Pirellulaceae bacterium]|nr:sugar transferase [Pirellulaceae bacterium]